MAAALPRGLAGRKLRLPWPLHLLYACCHVPSVSRWDGHPSFHSTSGSPDWTCASVASFATARDGARFQVSDAGQPASRSVRFPIHPCIVGPTITRQRAPMLSRVPSLPVWIIPTRAGSEHPHPPRIPCLRREGKRRGMEGPSHPIPSHPIPRQAFGLSSTQSSPAHQRGLLPSHPSAPLMRPIAWAGSSIDTQRAGPPHHHPHVIFTSTGSRHASCSSAPCGWQALRWARHARCSRTDERSQAPYQIGWVAMQGRAAVAGSDGTFGHR